jgi:hypothetical protein
MLGVKLLVKNILTLTDKIMFDLIISIDRVQTGYFSAAGNIWVQQQMTEMQIWQAFRSKFW